MAGKVHVEIQSSSDDASDEDNISETGISQYTRKVNYVLCQSKNLYITILFLIILCSYRHVFSYHPFYFDFHSVRVIFYVSSGFYLWNVNRTPT
jgi:hypothetical protein